MESPQRIVRRFFGALDALPRWLRWVVCLPAGLLCSYVIDDFFTTLLDLSGLTHVYITESLSLRTVVLTFVAGVTVTAFPALLSPRPWPVGIVMFALGILLRAGTIAYSFMFIPYQRPRLFLAGEAMAVYALGSCLGLYLISCVVRMSKTARSGVTAASE